jgi:hypothetical protein
MPLSICLEPSIITCKIPRPGAILHSGIMYYQRVWSWRRHKHFELGGREPAGGGRSNDSHERSEGCSAQQAIDKGLCVDRLHDWWRLHARSVERLCNCFVELEVLTFSPAAIREAEEDLREFKRNMNRPRRESGGRVPYPEIE